MKHSALSERQNLVPEMNAAPDESLSEVLRHLNLTTKQFMNQRPAKPMPNRPILPTPAKPEVQRHAPAPLAGRPPQTGYYLLRLRLQYTNKAPRPLARIL